MTKDEEIAMLKDRVKTLELQLELATEIMRDTKSVIDSSKKFLSNFDFKKAQEYLDED